MGCSLFLVVVVGISCCWFVVSLLWFVGVLVVVSWWCGGWFVVSCLCLFLGVCLVLVGLFVIGYLAACWWLVGCSCWCLLLVG